MEKYCLIIDNEDQTHSIEQIEREARRQNFVVKCSQFNVGSTERRDLLTNNQIDFAKVATSFKEEFGNQKFHLIAFDWQLDDEKINGVELIRLFDENRIRANTTKVLYSGVLKSEVQDTLDKYKSGDIDFKRAWDQINTLIRIKIDDFVDRAHYEKSIVDTIKKIGEPIESILERKLREYSKMKFKAVYPQFEGLSLEDIADIIEKDIPRGHKFQSEIIEQLVAFLIELNNE